MKPHFIWNDISSLEYDLIITSIPPRIKPQLRGETIEVPGRHGSLFESEEAYDTKSLSIECTFVPNNKSEEDINNIIMELPLWLDGTGKLIISDYPYLYYEARITNVIPIERYFKRYRRFPIKFEVHPFSKTLAEYEINKTTTEEESFSIFSYYPVSPTIEVIGSGNITLHINNQAIHLKDIAGKIIIDCEFMNAILENGTNANNKVNGLPLAIVKEGCTISVTVDAGSTFESLNIKYRGLWI